MFRNNVEMSIRLQLVITFAFCLVSSLIIYAISSNIFGEMNRSPVIDYTMGINRIDDEARTLVRWMDEDIAELRNEYGEPDDEDSTEAEMTGKAAPATPLVPLAPAVPAVPENAAAAPGSGGQSAPAGAANSAAAPGQAGAASVNSAPTAATTGQTAPVGAVNSAATPGTSAAAGSATAAAVSPVLPPAPWPGGSTAVSKKAAANRQQDEQWRKKRIEEHIRHLVRDNNYKVLLTDLEGRVIYRTDNAAETTVDVHKIIKKAMDDRVNRSDTRKEFASFYPVNYDGRKSYLIVSGIPDPHITYRREDSPLSWLTAIAGFILLFYYLSRRKMRYIEDLASGMRIISTGNLEYRMIERSKDELGRLAADMNFMVSALQRKIEEERRAERVKNELITNVSHDLRTPLTLIMGYLRLLHDKKYENDEQAASFLSVAYQKSEKLKVLIDDLFHYTKLANHDIPMNKDNVCLNEMLEQLLEEYVTLADEEQLQIVRQLPHDKMVVHIDTDQVIRVFDNLLANAVKYSLKPGVITVQMVKEARYVVVRISNQCEGLSQEELDRLFERTYRVDSSRSSESGGSGLGLAIAKSIVEAHHGHIWAETDGNRIHFYVRLSLA
ncbi:HAMP domain-containing protein [Paenibacillus thalictri]|uniref:histidine kinase n=2 Tax=Paenibacillus thalictri TaxID=2527873 RepID=A0A4V2J502_9BACL|nr:HAMP domain-containing protein [Paenibacillus thalictri]